IGIDAVADDAVLLSPASLTLIEGASGSFGVALSTAPTGTVLIDLAAGDASLATPSPAQLAFTPGDWSVPQAVSVATTDDSVASGPRGTSITVAVNAASADSTYAALPDT